MSSKLDTMSSKHVNDEGKIRAPFEEKSVWIQLIAMVSVLGGYFILAGGMLLEGRTDLAPYIPKFVGAIVALVVVLIVGYSVAASVRRPEGRDERDQMIEWRAGCYSSWVVSAGAFFGLLGMAVEMENVWIAHFLLLSLFISQVAKYSLQLMYYRRGV